MQEDKCYSEMSSMEILNTHHLIPGSTGQSKRWAREAPLEIPGVHWRLWSHELPSEPPSKPPRVLRSTLALAVFLERVQFECSYCLSADCPLSLFVRVSSWQTLMN